MDSNKLKVILILGLAAFFAVYLGVAAATAQFEAIAWVAGFASLAFIILLGRSVWVLIAVGLAMQGEINALPGSPPFWLLATVVCMTMFALRFAMHRRDLVWRFDWLDVAVVLQMLVVGQAYLRNPTGLMILGGELAGGKQYFLFGAAIAAYFCIAFVKPDARLVKWVVIAMIVTLFLDGVVLTLSDWYPAFGMLLLPIYSNVNLITAVGGSNLGDLAEVRAGAGTSQIGRALTIPSFSMVRPLQCLNPLRFHLFAAVLAGSALVLMSGFRSIFAYLGAVFVTSALIRRKWADIVVAVVIGLLGLGILVVSGMVKELPFGVQRVLSVLPIEVAPGARLDAEKSTEWRVEMWRLVMTTDRYIDNKWLGDGFAINSREMKAILDAAQGAYSFMQSSQEQALAKGSYHGFHVETIRFTGVVGLLAALYLMFVAFGVALRLIRHFRGDPLFPYVAYLTIPVLIYPFWSMLVFGGYRAEFPQFIVTAGLLKMIDTLRLQRVREAAAVDTEAPVPVGARGVPALAMAPGQLGRNRFP